MPIVNIQGVGLVNFPDEMSREQINSAIEKEILPKFPEVQAQVPRGIVGGAKDIGASFVSGVGNLMQLPGQISELVGFTRTGDLPEQQKTGIQALGADIQKFGEEAKSPTLIAKEQLRAREIEKAEGFFQEAGAALRTTATDPALLTSFFAEQIPNLIGTYGFGALGKGGAKLLMKEATEQAMAKVGVGSAVSGGAVMQGTDVGYDTYQTIYKQLRDQGVPDEEAQGIALSKGRVAAIEAAGLSIASARLPGGTAIERALVGKGMPGTAGFVKSTVGETLSEAIEEGGGAFAKQVGIQEVFPETDLLKGVGAATALGGLGGALFGAPAGVVNALRARQETPPPLVPPVEPPAPTGFIPPEEPPAAPPVETLPPEQPTAVAPTAQPVTPPTFAEPEGDPFKNYFTGMPDGSEIIFQNRDRSTQASIAQMQGIAAAPDYKRVSYSRDFGNGAPVVISDIDLESSLAKYPDNPIGVTGAKDFAVLPNGQSVPMMYAVVESGTLLTSNNADGSKRALYEDPDKPGLRAIAGNGRIAGITKAYTTPENSEAAEKYKNDLIADAKNLGIDPEVVNKMAAPVLVRVMPKSYLTPDIADLSNRPTVARLSPVETAKNDIRRFDLGGLEFNEDGTPSGKTLMQFINAMPVEERTELTDKSGRPTTQAIDRLANAIFQKAYGSDALIDLYAQAADPEAKTILNALARVAPKMAQLEGAGEYDVRNAIIQAAELAVNARRTGMNLKTAAQQIGLDVDPNSALVLDMFADNVRSGKRIGERLGALADEALKQTQAGTDMFGEVPKKPLSEIYGVLKTPMEEPDLFGEPSTEVPETKEFKIKKTAQQIQEDIKGMSLPQLAKWAVDNAPNSLAKAIAQKILDRMEGFERIKLPMNKLVIRGGANRPVTYYGRTSFDRRTDNRIGISLRGLDGEGRDVGVGTDKAPSGLRYSTILHELVHATTLAQTRYFKKQDPIIKELNDLLDLIDKQVKIDKKNIDSAHPAVRAIIKDKKPYLQDIDELLAYGNSDAVFQDYLSTIKVGEKTAFDKLVEIARKLLGLNAEYETGLDRLMRLTQQIYEPSAEQLQAKIAITSGVSFGQVPSLPPITKTISSVTTTPTGEAPPLLKAPPSFKLKKGRNEQVVLAARELAAGRITKQEFDAYVDYYMPINTIIGDKLESPIEDDLMRDILVNKISKKKDPEKVNAPIPDGRRVGLRMDIPALDWGRNNGVNGSVVSIHEGKPPTNAASGPNISYKSTGALKDVVFAIRREDEAFKIAQQAPKELVTTKSGKQRLKDVDDKKPQQTMEGRWVNMTPEATFKLVKEKLNDPDWSQISLDPLRHSYFYDRKNKQPVVSADEVLQVGRFVLAKNVKYADRDQFLYEEIPWSERETPNAFGRETALTEMYNRMENAYDETASPDEAYDLAYENATQEEKAILRQLKKDGMLGFDYPHQAIQAIIQEPQNFDLSSTLKSSISRLGNKLVKDIAEENVTAEESIAPIAIAKAKEMLQKRKPIPMGAFADVDPKLVQLAQPVFYPQQKTIIDRIEGLRDNFWKKTAQGIADQFRAIKDYSEEGYMQARLSKTVDGALEGLTFFGQVFNDSGALNIKQGTKGLMDIMKPIGQEVDRYQMWVALNRESQLPMEKRTKMPNMAELIKRRNEFADGTIDGKPRLEIYNKVRSEMNTLNKSVLKVALDAGLIDSSRQKIDDLNARDFLTTKDKEILTRPYREEIERIENKKAMNVTEEDKDILKDYRALVRDINSLNNMTPDLRQELVDYYTNNPGAYERFSADINYIPFYRAMEDGDLQGASTASGLTNQQFSKELTGGERPYGDLMENTLRNWSHILSASMKNQAVNTIMKDATNFGAVMPNLKLQYEFIDGNVVNRSTGEIIGDGSVKPYMTTADKGTVKMMNDGQPIYYRVVDPMLLDSISSIGYMGPKSKFLDVARDFKNMLQFGVTISPAFKVRNLFRDSISAIAVTDLKKNPFANVIDGWVASNRNNPAHISALAGGAIFNFGTAYEGDQSKLIKRLLDQGVDANTILDSPDKVKKGLTILWEKYKDWGNKSESANRMALYNQLKDKGYDHLQASFYARDLLDFSMQGSWPAFRLAAQTIPFLNARVQGLYKLGRDGITPTSRVLYNTITGKEIDANDAQKARAFGYTTLAVAMASMLLYMAFKDDEEFQKREAWDRDNFWWFRLPGMEAAFRVPKPFEIGAFGTMAERVLEQIVDQGAEGKAFGDSVFRMLTDTFAINPIPQMIRPLVDLYANKDAFTGAPIESAGMERLSKQERVTDNTSPIAQALGGLSSIFGEKVSLSPVQVDYAIKAYFGWLGGTATQASVYATVPFRDGAYPDIKLMDKASQGFIKSLPSDQSRFVTSFYENNKEINQAYADMRHYAELGETDKVQKILEEKGDKIALNKMYDKTAKEMANVRAQIRVITNDKTMDGTTKREMIDRMKQILSALSEQAENARKSLKPK